MTPRPIGALPADLTPAELDVVRLAAAGLSVSETAAELTKSRSTIQTQREHVLEKLGVPNITAAVAAALRRDLIA